MSPHAVPPMSDDASSLNSYFLGLDFGTSGARATVINGAGDVMADVKMAYGDDADKDWATTWQRVLYQLTTSIPADICQHVAAVAFDGTSATAMLVDQQNGQMLAPVKLYNASQSSEAVAAAKDMAPAAHTATASTSTLCKLLTWHMDGTWQQAAVAGAQPRLLHQADWLASLLHGNRCYSDWNNALKLGFDPEIEAYPSWLMEQQFADVLPPNVVAPGTPIATITPSASATTKLPSKSVVCAGTTDSIAAFIAAGVDQVGQSVTSLGSTLAVKLLSDTRVDNAAYGVYSHRLGNGWLVGGASNTGGAVLRKYFTNDQLVQLSSQIDPSTPSGLDYYPLPAKGERFPVSDPHLEPRLQPRPEDDALFLKGLLEGMSRIEADAYAVLQRLGASPVTQVLTAGGGAGNPVWTAMRQTALGVPVSPAKNGDASYGAALLAKAGYQKTADKQTVSQAAELKH
eukprot:jgi/Chrzof1/9053/Cz03g34110.t1